MNIEMPCDDIDDNILVTATDELFSDVDYHLRRSELYLVDVLVLSSVITLLLTNVEMSLTLSRSSTLTDNTPPVWDFDCEGTFEYEQCPDDADDTAIEVVHRVYRALDSWEIGGNTIPSLDRLC